MAERQHVPPIGHGRTPVTAGDVAELVRRVSAQPVYVDVVFAGTTTESARHGLGRRYVGGIVIGASASHTANIAVVTPEAAAGIDPATHVLVDAGGSYTGTVRVWML